MSRNESKKLAHGVYRFHWKSGGSSLGSVGSLYDGRRWFLPCNWTGAARVEASTDWRRVARVERVA